MHSGEPSVHFVNSMLATVVLAAFVLWRYRRAVLAGMSAGNALPLPWAAVSPAQPAATAVMTDPQAIEGRARRRLATAWLLTTALCGLPMAAVYMWAGDMGASPTYALGLTASYTLAALPVIVVSLALSPWRAVALLLALVASAMALFLLCGVVERGLSGRPLTWRILGLVPLWAEVAWNQLWMAGLFWLLSWPTRLRGVVPVTFAALLVFGAAPFLGSQLSGWMATTEAGTPWVFRLGTDGMFLLIALPAGGLAWWRLHRLAAGYEAKRFSDAQLLARTWWLMLVVTIAGDLLSGREQPWIALGLLVGQVLLFAPVNAAMLHVLGVRQRAAARVDARAAPTLLVLRVFGFTARTERLFDRVVSRWRLLGPVTMIAAPDVSARTIAAGDYLRWLTGRVDELFVTSQADLDTKLRQMDLQPDPDGRFRVNSFCCRDATWQATVVALMERADVVAMDLRSLRRGRQGCEFELQQLAQRMPPQRLVLVVDETTERSLLEAAFGERLALVHTVHMRRAWQADAVFNALSRASASQAAKAARIGPAGPAAATP
jgi:hypothetical protein